MKRVFVNGVGVCSMLAEKRKELGDAADKLRNGLHKIDETSVKVESMSVELEIAKGKGEILAARNRHFLQ